MSAGPARNTLRIIGGTWRSRRLPFIPAADVRPSPDRIRETLFNWLQPCIVGARCLDLFAGSGALGFEALSRGANEVVMVDQDIRVIQQLRHNGELLRTTAATLVWQDALDYLASADGHFDIVFLDPPFRDEILAECCRQLDQRRLLAPQARVYLEYARRSSTPSLPPGWELLHDKQAGQVHYALAGVRNHGPDPDS